MSYQKEPWFALLQTATKSHPRKDIAALLGVSAPTVSQVLNASGKYGTGAASTVKLGERVIHTFGRYECPHLTEQAGEAKVITADVCRTFAHRAAPTGSPRDMQHWQACQACPHKAASAPPVPRESKPRKAAPETASPTEPNQEPA